LRAVGRYRGRDCAVAAAVGGRKRFFFEKKKQKLLFMAGVGTVFAANLRESKFFASFCSQKEGLCRIRYIDAYYVDAPFVRR
jgi:hypothetical protein